MIHRMDPPQDPERKPMPDRLEPMLAKLVKKPPAPDDAWGFEFKWDGIRAEGYVEGGTVRLVSRSGEIVTARYPEVHAMGRALGSKEVILDGEIVALDDKGRPSFEEIQQRMGLTSESEIRRKMKEVPVTYMLFDVMWQDGHSLLKETYADRRKKLEGLKLKGASWQTPPYEKGGGAARRGGSRKAGGGGDARGEPQSGARGHHGQEARLVLRAGPAHRGLGEDQEPRPPGIRDRRMGRGRGQAKRAARRAARGLLRQEQVRLCGQGWDRVHLND